MNKTPLTARTNRIIGGDAPSICLGKLKKNHGAVAAVLERSLRSHLIDPVLLDVDDLKGFFGARQAALLEQISVLMGKQLESNPADVAVEDEIEEVA